MPKKRNKKTIIERVEIVDRMEVRAATWDKLIRDGYRVTHSGPCPTGRNEEWQMVDLNWFKVIAERVVK